MNKSSGHILITGGSSGIGKELAKLFTQEGYNLSLIARNLEKLTAVQQELNSYKKFPSQEIFSYSADVGNSAQIEAAVNKSMEQLGIPDILITCAGLAHPDYFENLSLEVFTETMQVNYFGSLYAVKAVISAMQSRGKGHLVFIGSGAGLLGVYGYSAYSPSKFAVRGLAESLRAELKPWGIDVSIVYPGDTDTPQLAAENLTKPPETKAITASAKVWQAAEVARVILAGIKRKSFVITPGLEMTFLARFHSLLGTLINQYLDGLVSQVRQRKS